MDSRKKITELRNQIDEIDHTILDLYQQRLQTVLEIAELKAAVGMGVEQPSRLQEIRKERADYAKNTAISESTLEQLITLFHDDAVKIQHAIEPPKK